MKHLIPFPFSLNIGTDIVQLSRIHRLINRPPASPRTNNNILDRFSRRILCDQELHYFRAKFAEPLSTVPHLGFSRNTEVARWLAGRFAAKEAARKAAPGGASAVSWKDVMVRIEGVDGAKGRPEVIYLKDGGEKGEVGKLSISHDGDYVVATVLAASASSNG